MIDRITDSILFRRVYARRYWAARKVARAATTPGQRVALNGQARRELAHWIHYQRITVWRPDLAQKAA